MHRNKKSFELELLVSTWINWMQNWVKKEIFFQENASSTFFSASISWKLILNDSKRMRAKKRKKKIIEMRIFFQDKRRGIIFCWACTKILWMINFKICELNSWRFSSMISLLIACQFENFVVYNLANDY